MFNVKTESYPYRIIKLLTLCQQLFLFLLKKVLTIHAMRGII
nr:MAG TPA: hypothetical protein [Caudoviricetes sp.]